mgnify:CR=1 FL=1
MSVYFSRGRSRRTRRPSGVLQQTVSLHRLTPWLAAVLLGLVPVAPYSIGADPAAGIGVSLELVLAWAVLHRAGNAARWGLAAGWAVLVSFTLMRAASRIASDVELPIGDLFLLVRPLVVVTRDLYGAPIAYGALAIAALLPLSLVAVGRWLWEQADQRRPVPPLALVVAVGLVVLPGSRSVGLELTMDAWKSWTMAAAFRAEQRARATSSLEQRQPKRKPHIELLIVESYGMVTGELADAPRWRATLAELQRRTEASGWSTVSGVSVAPVHGSRSWVADASVFTGLKISHQSDFERAIRRVPTITTLPSWFADRGWQTLLMRQADRARPGVHLQNHFDFQHTTFFDDLDYRGPSAGWGYIPDQFALHRLRHDRLPALPDGPHLAFVHLATSHVPWSGVPPLLDDPLAWQTRRGAREWQSHQPSPWEALRLVARRFRPPNRQAADIDEIQARYVHAVDYSLRATVRTLPDPAEHPALLIVMGDHQPPFLAPGRPPDVPVHVLASDPQLLETFREAGFGEGWTPSEGRIAHHDLLPMLVDVVSR